MIVSLFLTLLSTLISSDVQGQRKAHLQDSILNYNLKTTGNESAYEGLEATQLRNKSPWQLRASLEVARSNNDTSGVLENIIDLSTLFWELGHYDSSLAYVLQGLQFCDCRLHRPQLFALYNLMGNNFDNNAKFTEAYQAYQKAERFTDGNPLLEAKAYNNMGIVLRMLGYPEKALGYLEKAADIVHNSENAELWVSVLWNMSIAYSTLGYRDAKQLYLDSAIKIASVFKKYDLLFTALTGQAMDLISKGRSHAALELLEAMDTLSIYATIRPRSRQHWHKAVGMAYHNLRDYHQAEKHLLLAGQGMNVRDWINLSIHLTEFYVTRGNYQKAYDLYRRYKEKEDSIGKFSVHLQVNELETQYRTAEKDKRLAEQKLLLLNQAHQVNLRTIWLVVIGCGSLLLAAFFLLFYRNTRRKQTLLRVEQENIRLKSLIEGEEQERERISGELHDGIGGILSAAKMSFSALRLSQESNTHKYAQGVQLLDDAYKELRRTAHNLSPVLLKKEGLIAAVSTFCDKVSSAYPPEIRFQSYGDFKDLSEALVLTTYRIIQELVHNAVKHAQAGQILVQLRREGSTLNIAVEDDGKGIHASTTSGGIGLENVQVRVRALHGTIDIDSREGAGTTVYVLFEW